MGRGAVGATATQFEYDKSVNESKPDTPSTRRCALNPIVAAYLGAQERLPRNAFCPNWGENILVFSESFDPTGKGPKVHVGARVFPGGMTIRTERLKPDVLTRAFALADEPVTTPVSLTPITPINDRDSK